MVNVRALLYEICGDERVYDPDCDLFATDLLDSLAQILLFTKLEDAGYELYPTRIDREHLRTPRRIEELLETL